MRYKFDEILDLIYSAGEGGIKSDTLCSLAGTRGIASKLRNFVADGTVRRKRDEGRHWIWYWSGGERKVGAPSVNTRAGRIKPRPCKVCGAQCRPGNVSCSPEHAEILKAWGREKSGRKSRDHFAMKRLAAREEPKAVRDEELAPRIEAYWRNHGHPYVKILQVNPIIANVNLARLVPKSAA